MSDSRDNQHYVRLSETVTVFEPMSSINSVFFDPANQQIFTLRSRGTMGVNVKRPCSLEAINFRIEDRGEVLSVKFSINNQLLAIQRTSNSVDFLNFSDGVPEEGEFSQTCKSKTSMLLGFVWTAMLEILLITTEHLELYHVNPVKRSLRLVKHVNLPAIWFAWDVNSRMLVVSTGTTEVVCHVFPFKTHGVLNKICQFTLHHSLESRTTVPLTPGSVLQNNCLLASIYRHVYFFVVHSAHDDVTEKSRKVLLYKLISDGPAKVTNVLVVCGHGPVAISLLDNLVLVHSHSEKTTAVYDIAVGGVKQNDVVEHQPVFPPLSMAPLTVASSSVPVLSAHMGARLPVELYSADWVVGLPNVVMDGNLGCLWTLELNNHIAPQLIQQQTQIVDFLLNRDGAKDIILEYCTQLAQKSITDAASYALKPEDDYTFDEGGLNERLDEFTYLFKRLGEIAHHQLQCRTPTTSLPTDSSCDPPFYHPFAIQQADINTHVFLVPHGNEGRHVRAFFYAVLMEYIRSLVEHEVPVDHWLYELLISSIARLENYSQLSYCIQGCLLADSKPIALQLLSLETVYPAASQLAVDMLKRLKVSNEEILEVLLLKGRLIEALRFCQMTPKLLHQQIELPKRFMESAMQSEDKCVFFSVFRYFQCLAPQGVSLKSADCEQLVQKFSNLFGNSVQ